MKGKLTEHQDRFWDYNNPFAIENDEFEKLVQSRVDAFGPNKKSRHRQPKMFDQLSRRQKRIKNEFDDIEQQKKTQRNPKSYQRKQKHLYLPKNQSTFVSSETKPLRKTPRVILHLPSPAAATIRYEESESNSYT